MNLESVAPRLFATTSCISSLFLSKTSPFLRPTGAYVFLSSRGKIVDNLFCDDERDRRVSKRDILLHTDKMKKKPVTSLMGPDGSSAHSMTNWSW